MIDMQELFARIVFGLGLAGLILIIAIRVTDWKDKTRWHSSRRINLTLLAAFILGLVMMIGDWLLRNAGE